MQIMKEILPQKVGCFIRFLPKLQHKTLTCSVPNNSVILEMPTKLIMNKNRFPKMNYPLSYFLCLFLKASCVVFKDTSNYKNDAEVNTSCLCFDAVGRQTKQGCLRQLQK
ncbi:hypothetical protein V8G54_013544 [Vigna mungo]|uniref:Uncharacterized protein n=1 Tax=Vigna mungo TaxID=3915 RepID=A0AAQ3S4D8_VIGMU